MATPIRLSVVIVWRDEREGIVACLHSLVKQVEAAEGEVIVVSDKVESELISDRDVFPHLRWLHIDPPLTEPRAWQAGLRIAQGETVAFGQARCRYTPGWAEAALSARMDKDHVATGPVMLGQGHTLAGRANYLCDYGAFANPAGERSNQAPSNNIAFERRALSALSEGQGLHKSALLRRRKFRVVWAPAMEVTIRPVRSFLSDAIARFHRGRQYAALRAREWSWPSRIVCGVACVFLPALLFARLLRSKYVRMEFSNTITIGFPWIATSLATWSFGEMIGYWTGPGVSQQFA